MMMLKADCDERHCCRPLWRSLDKAAIALVMSVCLVAAVVVVVVVGCGRQDVDRDWLQL